MVIKIKISQKQAFFFKVKVSTDLTVCSSEGRS